MLTGIVFHSIGIGDAPFNSGINGIDVFGIKGITKFEQVLKISIGQIGAADTPALINFTDAKETRRL